MAKKRNKRAKRSSLDRRLETVDRKRRKRADEDAELLALAALPVPPGSGLMEIGRGKHAYIKASTIDGSMRVLRFHSHAAVEEAMARGVAADMEAERDPTALLN